MNPLRKVPRNVHRLCLVSLLTFGGLRAAEQPTAASDVEIRHDIEFAKVAGIVLHADLAWPANPKHKPMPGIIYVHGGGWKQGKYTINGPRSWPGTVASGGYFIASVQYRLSGEAAWPAQIQDCKLAVRWLRANAAHYNVDPDRIGCWGTSAGGHLVVCLGTMSDPRFEGDGGYPGVSSAVQAVADFCGPTDFTAGSEGITGKTGGDAPILVALFGGNFESKSALWKDGSPLTYVRAGDPPFLVAHGTQDRTVPPDQSKRLVAALAQAGVPVEFIPVKGAGHPLAAPKGMPPASPDIKTLLGDVTAFFDRTLAQ
jgi:acetyl esterase/lipase